MWTMARSVLLHGIIIISGVCSITKCHNITDIQMLKRALFEHAVYDQTVRPVINQSRALDIDIAFVVTSIVDFDLLNGRLVVTGYLYTSWIDEQLRWEPVDYNGLTKLKLEKDSLWTPRLSNIYDDSSAVADSTLYLRLDGRVKLTQVKTFTAMCYIDITYYPYDENTCLFQFYMISDERATLRLTALSDTLNTGTIIPHGEWSITSSSAQLDEIFDPQIQVWATSYVGSMTLRRRPGFVLLHTYFPLLLLHFASTLTFRVPLDKGERVSFSITLLLALIFFSSSISATFPKSSLETSYLSITMTLAICAGTLGDMLSVILVDMASWGGTPIPKVWRWLSASNFGRERRRSEKTNTDERDKTYEDNNDSNKQKIPRNDLQAEVAESEAVTWSHVAMALNNVVFWIYFVLILLRVGTLLILHHLR